MTNCLKSIFVSSVIILTISLTMVAAGHGKDPVNLTLFTLLVGIIYTATHFILRKVIK